MNADARYCASACDFRLKTFQFDYDLHFCWRFVEDLRVTGSNKKPSTSHSTFGVTWRHWSRDHLIPHMSFPIGGSLERSLYLKPFSKYCALSVLRSRLTSLTFQCHHDHLIANMPFPNGGPLEPSLYLTVSDIFNVDCNAMIDIWHDLDTTSKQRSRSFILVPINFSYAIARAATSHRLSIVTFALGRTVCV